MSMCGRIWVSGVLTIIEQLVTDYLSMRTRGHPAVVTDYLSIYRELRPWARGALSTRDPNASWSHLITQRATWLRFSKLPESSRFTYM